MKEIVFASGNPNKVEEIGHKLGQRIRVIGLKDIGCTEDIAETGTTLRENARIKARYIFDHYGKNCFADDTGLMIDALNGAPGVYSARYAGDHKNTEDNRAKALRELSGELHRTAHFVTVICCIIRGEEYFFEGKVSGHIAREPRGDQGFGYDPIFFPNTNSRTFAQMTNEEKNILSHRGKAVKALQAFLDTQSF